MRRARKKPSVTAEFIATWRRLALPTTEATNLAKSREMTRRFAELIVSFTKIEIFFPKFVPCRAVRNTFCWKNDKRSSEMYRWRQVI